MSKSRQEQQEQLGMSYSTARSRLVKMILFDYAKTKEE